MTGAAKPNLALVTLALVIIAATVYLVHDAGTGRAAFPTFNGDIVLSRDDASGSHLWARPPGGGEPVQLTSEPGFDYDATYSADGAMIAFSHQELIGVDRAIWVINANGSGAHEVPNTDNGSDPAWSPDGGEIVFAITGDLFRINTDGTGLTNITNTQTKAESDPDWSSDGTQLLFASRDTLTIENPTEIEMMTPSGTDRHALTSTAHLDEGHPDFAPDSDHIIYDAANVDTGDRNIFSMHIDGGNPQPMTQSHEGWQQTPTYSPDGTRIAYSQSSADTFAITQVYVMDADGSDPVRLSTGGIELLPDWQPLETEPTSAPTPTPTEPPAGQSIWGDVDCDGGLTTRDNQAELRFVLQQNALAQTEPCADIGSHATVAGTHRLWGDEDCDGSVTTRDNQSKLRFVLQQNPLSQTEPCPDIGAPFTIVPP